MDMPSITAPYQASNLYATPLQGMQRAQASMQDSAVSLAQGDIQPRHFVNMTGAEYAFKANALVLKTMDNMQGTLLNTFA